MPDFYDANQPGIAPGEKKHWRLHVSGADEVRKTSRVNRRRNGHEVPPESARTKWNDKSGDTEKKTLIESENCLVR